MKHLKNLRSSGTRVTVASLNVITSAGAERGDIDRTMAMLEEFEHNNIEPNADTFSFCFEAIWKNLDRRTRKVPTEEFIVSCLSEADNLLTMMEEMKAKGEKQMDVAPTGLVLASNAAQ